MNIFRWSFRLITQIIMVLAALLLLGLLGMYIYTQVYNAPLAEVLPANIKSIAKTDKTEEIPTALLQGKPLYAFADVEGSKGFALPFITTFHAEKALKKLTLDNAELEKTQENGINIISGIGASPLHFAYNKGWLIASDKKEMLQSIIKKEAPLSDNEAYAGLQKEGIMDGERFAFWNTSSGSPEIATSLSEQWNAQFPVGGWSEKSLYNGKGRQIRFVSKLKEDVKVQFAPPAELQSVPKILNHVPFDSPLVFVHRDLAAELNNVLEFFRLWHPNLAVIWKSALSGLLVEQNVPAEDFDALTQSFIGESALIILPPDGDKPRFILLGQKSADFNPQKLIAIMKVATIKDKPKLVERKLEDGSTLQEFELADLSEIPVENKKNRKFESFRVGDLSLMITDEIFVLGNSYQQNEKLINRGKDVSLAMNIEVQDALIQRFSPSGGYILGQGKQVKPLLTQMLDMSNNGKKEEALPDFLADIDSFKQIIMTQRFDGQFFRFDGIMVK